MALGLRAGPPGPKPPHAQLHLHLGSLDLHSVPLQPRGEGRLPALQGSCQGPQHGRPGRRWLAHPAVGVQGRVWEASCSWSFPGAPTLSAAPTTGLQTPRPICTGRGVTQILSALGARTQDSPALGGLRLPSSHAPRALGFPTGPPLPGGGLVSSLHGTSDILGSALGHIAMEAALRVLDGSGAPGSGSLETAPDEEPKGGRWAGAG